MLRVANSCVKIGPVMKASSIVRRAVRLPIMSVGEKKKKKWTKPLKENKGLATAGQACYKQSRHRGGGGPGVATAKVKKQRCTNCEGVGTVVQLQCFRHRIAKTHVHMLQSAYLILFWWEMHCCASCLECLQGKGPLALPGQEV